MENQGKLILHKLPWPSAVIQIPKIEFFLFVPPWRDKQKIPSLRSLRLCGECNIVYPEGTIGYLAPNQAITPPARTLAFLYPISIDLAARPAAVPSLGQPQ